MRGVTTGEVVTPLTHTPEMAARARDAKNDAGPAPAP
ncbi:hypothetical protein SFUMM280S_09836 [Streptomyces fumanus]